MSDMTLAQALEWSTFDVAADLAAGTVPVRIGEVGGEVGGEARGPVGVLLASVHGDEGPWGTLAINELLSSTTRDQLLGRVRVVPVAHPLATAADARQSELDLLDLNSSFPGDAKGTHTQRLAAVLAEHALDGADVVLDVHGGGSWNINCFTYRFPGSEELAGWIRTPLIFDGPERGAASVTGYARSKGAQAVWIEMGGRGGREQERASHVARGLRHALGRAGVMTPVPEFGPEPLVVKEKTALTTSSAGIYRPRIREEGLGSVIDRGTLIGELLDPVTSRVLEEFRAPYERSVLALLRPTVARIEAPGKPVAVAGDVSGLGR